MGVMYPGFGRLPHQGRLDLLAGQLRALPLRAGDLVSFRQIDGYSQVWILGGDQVFDDMPSAQQLPSDAWDETALEAAVARGELTKPETGLCLFAGPQPCPEPLVLRARTPARLWVGLPCPQRHLAKGAGGQIAIDVSRHPASDFDLPPPLGKVVREFRVPKASALAYELKRGQYVQVIDVEGRQCSDFMALHLRDLDAGTERFIDSTVTRTLVGGAYPAPGLFSRFFDQDLRPLLALRQDTVGRHDTFALACTALGYENRGYPGHVNCSDNISDAWMPWGVGRKRAWPAINFFFNSEIDPQTHQLSSDEAWSRPGDYVAMQALEDLLCVSTACPDDVDPINGWNPTEVHVRIYEEDTAIRQAVAYRPTPDAEPRMTTESPFHPRTSALTKSFTVANDLWLPARFDGVGTLAEVAATRQAATLQDMSSLRKYDIVGPDVEQLLDLALTKTASKLPIHRGFYALLLHETGAVIDDGILFRLEDKSFRWLCANPEGAEHLRALAAAEGLRAFVLSRQAALCNLALQGPKSRTILTTCFAAHVRAPDLGQVRWFGSTVGRIDGRAVYATRTGYTGELGYEIFTAPSDAPEVWDALMAAGAAHGIEPQGTDALTILRVEAGLVAGGGEFTPGVDALEAGLAFAIDFNKDRFVGKAALERNKRAERNRLVGLHFDGAEVPRHGDGLFIGPRQIGTITSAVMSPHLGRPLALARLSIEHAKLGTELEVGKLDGHAKRLTCRVAPTATYDPTRTRARA